MVRKFFGNRIQSFFQAKVVPDSTATYFKFHFGRRKAYIQMIILEFTSLPNADGEYLFLKGLINKDAYTNLHPTSDGAFLSDYLRMHQATSGIYMVWSRREYKIIDEVVHGRNLGNFVNLALFHTFGGDTHFKITVKYTRKPLNQI